MSLISDAIKAGFSDLLAFGGESLTLNGITQSCVASSIERGTTLVIGGFEVALNATFQLSLEAALAADPALVISGGTLCITTGGVTKPVNGSVVTFNGEAYRVLLVTIDPGQTSVILRCGSTDA